MFFYGSCLPIFKKTLTLKNSFSWSTVMLVLKMRPMRWQKNRGPTRARILKPCFSQLVGQKKKKQKNKNREKVIDQGNFLCCLFFSIIVICILRTEHLHKCTFKKVYHYRATKKYSTQH